MLDQENLSLIPHGTIYRLTSSELHGLYQFNAAIFRVGDAWCLAFRVVVNQGQRKILICKLGKDFCPISNTIKDLSAHLDDDEKWHADPRVFWIETRLFMIYNCKRPYKIEANRSIRMPNAQYVVELDPKNLLPLSTPRSLVLRGLERQLIEKNWQFFSKNRKVFVQYSIDPLIILEAVNFFDDSSTYIECTAKYGTDVQIPEADFRPRGGTPPLLIDDRFWAIHHYVKRDENNKLVYRGGWYSFDATEPFRNCRFIVEPKLELSRPIHLPPLNTRTASVIYPVGAVFDFKSCKWAVSYGINDQQMELVILQHPEPLPIEP